MNSGDSSDLTSAPGDNVVDRDLTPSDQVSSVYELLRCQEWIRYCVCTFKLLIFIHIVLIRSEKLTRVALQFPDSLLHDSHNVISQLQVRPLTMVQIVDKPINEIRVACDMSLNFDAFAGSCW